jgi:hypothetical protein
MGEALMLRQIDQTVILPALKLLPRVMESDNARVMMLAIGLQESGFRFRTQHFAGPARGFWQFERDGGVRGVLKHPATAIAATKVCDAHHVTPTAQDVWEVLQTDDVLAAAFARLLLWTDPHVLVESNPGSVAPESWLCYLRTWRPGKPRPETWDGNYARAVDWVLRGVDS